MSAGAALLAALSVWTAAGTLAVAGPGPGRPRIGILPPLWVLGVLVVVAVGAAFALARGTRHHAWTLPLFASGLAVLPWLPLPVPPAFLVWTGPLLLLVATAVVLTLVCQWLRTFSHRSFASDPRQAPKVAAAIAIVLYAVAAWRVAPMIPGGDEPHYLIITQSLLYDFDLQIENNHTRGDHRAYVAMDLRPDYIVRGTNGAIYSIHMPGLSALVAPAFLIGGHPGTAAFVILLAAAAGALLWRIAFLVAGHAGAAWFGWASVAFSVPIVFHAFTIYPDSAAPLPVLIGVFAMLRASAASNDRTDSLFRWMLYGTALATLPWLHSRFALLAGGLGAMTVLRLWGRRNWLRRAAAFLAVPLASAIGWFAFFQVLYGSPNPRAQYGGLLDAISSPWFITSGIGGLLFDQQFGVLTHAPVYACAIAGLGLMLLRRTPTGSGSSLTPHARLAVEILLLIAAYVISTTTMRMWWGGWSAPGRFVVPLLPLLGIAAAVAWRSASRRATRAVMLAALGASSAMSAALVWVDRGRLAYDIRQTDALWLEWAGPLVDLARGVPTFLRSPEPAAWIQTVVWIGALVMAWWILRAADGSVLHSRSAIALGLAALFATAGMAALSIVWLLNATRGIQPAFAQLDLLRAVAERRGIGVGFEPLRRMRLDEIPGTLTILAPPGHREGRDGQLMSLPGPIPAGTYEVQTVNVVLRVLGQPAPPMPPPDGRITAGIAREFVPLWELPLNESRPLMVDVPVDVRAIVVRHDEAAASHLDFVSLHPKSTVPASRLPTRDFALQARRYGQTVAYFMDEGAFPEPDAFWIRGTRTASVVFHPDVPRPAITIALRNAPVENTFTVESGTWKEEMLLGPGEERRMGIPFDPTRGSSLVRFTSASGFRPSEVDPGSTDQRFLGVWVRVENVR